MNAVAVPKSARLNLLEGMTLTAILQGIPAFAGGSAAAETGGKQPDRRPDR